MKAWRTHERQRVGGSQRSEGHGYAPTPGYFGRTPEALSSPSPVPYRTTDQPQSDQLNFLPFAEWEESGEYDEEPHDRPAYSLPSRLSHSFLPLNSSRIRSSHPPVITQKAELML
jgi:hypothetical protein